VDCWQLLTEGEGGVTWPESGTHAGPAIDEAIDEGSQGEGGDDGAVGECGDDGAETPPPPEPQEGGGEGEADVGLIAAECNAAAAVAVNPGTVAPLAVAQNAGLLPLLAPMLTSGWTAAEVAFAAVQAPHGVATTRERREPAPTMHQKVHGS
jgi:hypothetical protein